MFRRVLLPGALCLFVACGGGSDGGSPAGPSPSPTPTPSTFALRGSVSEAPPTEATAIAGATVEIVDGPDAGKTQTTDGSGAFTFTGLRQAGFTVRARAANFEERSVGVTLTSDLTRSFQLKPVFRVITSSRTDTVSGGDEPCPDGFDACKTFSLSIHHDGELSASCTWSDRDTWIWLELYDITTGERIARSSSSRVNGLRQRISTRVTGGRRYFIAFRYALGARTTTFTSTVSRPS